MNEAEARELRRAHDSYVRFANRQPKSHLVELYRTQLAARGVQMLYGGPASKDELVRAVVNELYPTDKLNESIHVLYHNEGETWSACEHCHPHQGADCECSLGRTTV